MELEYSLEIF